MALSKSNAAVLRYTLTEARKDALTWGQNGGGYKVSDVVFALYGTSGSPAGKFDLILRSYDRYYEQALLSLLATLSKEEIQRRDYWARYYNSSMTERRIMDYEREVNSLRGEVADLRSLVTAN